MSVVVLKLKGKFYLHRLIDLCAAVRCTKEKRGKGLALLLFAKVEKRNYIKSLQLEYTLQV